MGRYRKLEARVAELEKKLGNIDKNMAYIRDNIETAVKIELDNAWYSTMENYKFDARRNAYVARDIKK